MLVPFFFELRAAGVPVSLDRVSDAARGAQAARGLLFRAKSSTIWGAWCWSRMSGISIATIACSPSTSRVPSGLREDRGRRAGRMAALAGRASVQRAGRNGRSKSLGSWDKLLETLRERLKEQQERHQGGSKWIGTGGTSPFGADGYNPEGVRIGQDRVAQSTRGEGVGRREYRNFDDNVELGTRNIKMALRKLRRFAREGARGLLDLDGTISATARNAGLLDLKMVAGAAQRGEGAAAAGCRRLDGRPHQGVRGNVLRRAHRVQAPRVFLFPQLHLRISVEGQPAPASRTHVHAADAAHLQFATIASCWSAMRP